MEKYKACETLRQMLQQHASTSTGDIKMTMMLLALDFDNKYDRKAFVNCIEATQKLCELALKELNEKKEQEE